MSDALWHHLSPEVPSPSNRIYIEKFGGDAVPGNFIILCPDPVGRTHAEEENSRVRVGRILRKNDESTTPGAIINLFLRPQQLPSRYQTLIGPLADPSTRFLGEIVQSGQVINATSSEFLRFAHCYHHDTVADDIAPLYLQGMEDCYVIRYRYSSERDRYVYIIY